MDAMASNDRTHPAARLDGKQRALVVLEILLAVGAAGGSWGLVSGAIDASSYVDRLPWSSTVFGGVALALLVAVPATVAAAATLRRLSWARDAHVVVGALLMGWIVVQVGFIGLSSWLQPVMFAWGAAILGLGWRDRGGGR